MKAEQLSWITLGIVALMLGTYGHMSLDQNARELVSKNATKARVLVSKTEVISATNVGILQLSTELGDQLKK